jgi:hypothetical protein
MLVDIRLSPQAQKERAIKEVFAKMNLDQKWQDKVLDDFFRSEPAILSDIGYWNNRFYIKDVSLAEFLAEQIASRVRIEFREDKNLADIFLVKSAKGEYAFLGAKHFFKLEVFVEQKMLKEMKNTRPSDRIFKEVLRVAGGVLHGYKFEAFDYVEVLNKGDGELIRVLKDDLEAFRKKKAKLEEILR